MDSADHEAGRGIACRCPDTPFAYCSQWWRSFLTFLGVTAGAAAFLIGLLVTYDVLGRTLFRSSNSWVTEITIYLMAYIAFVGSAYLLMEGAHVKVDILAQSLSVRRRRAMALAADCIMLAVVAMLTWASYGFVSDAWESNEVSDTIFSVPLWLPYLAFFLGMLLLLVTSVINLVHGASLARRPHD